MTVKLKRVRKRGNNLVNNAWDAEIRRRLAEIKAGTAELIDREELRRRMQARIKRA